MRAAYRLSCFSSQGSRYQLRCFRLHRRKYFHGPALARERWVPPRGPAAVRKFPGRTVPQETRKNKARYPTASAAFSAAKHKMEEERARAAGKRAENGLLLCCSLQILHGKWQANCFWIFPVPCINCRNTTAVISHTRRNKEEADTEHKTAP